MSEGGGNNHHDNNERRSNWSVDRIAELALISVLAAVGVGQLCTYRRQADIMDKQASIAATQNKIAESMGRAFVSPSIRIDDASIVIPSKGLNGPKATGYQFQPVVENSGTTPTDGLTFAGAATSCGASAQTWTNELGDKATMGIYPKQMIDVKLEDNKCPDFIKFPDSPTDPEDILKNAVTGRIFLGPHAKTDVGGVEMTPELLRYVIDGICPEFFVTTTHFLAHPLASLNIVTSWVLPSFLTVRSNPTPVCARTGIAQTTSARPTATHMMTK